MNKYLYFFILFFSINVNAQINADGTVIAGFSATDINNNVFSSSLTTNAGKHFIIDFSATWCSTCWSYHNTKVLNNYYNLYGPSGTATQDAEVLFYEGDMGTNMNDIDGLGVSTQGDWTMGTNYRIFNESMPSNVISSFTATGTIGFPTVFVVCSDNKMYRLATSMTDPAQVRTFVEQKCGLAPLSSATVHGNDFSYEIYPNPTTADFAINFNVNKITDVSYKLFNSFGQLVKFHQMSSINGFQRIKVETKSLAAGIYLLEMQVGTDIMRDRILVRK